MKPVVICGHRVTGGAMPDFGPDVGNCISLHDFERLLDKIARCRPVENWAGCLERQEIPSTPFALLTFDDGYRDIYSEALPLLERYAVPCVIFITTGFADRELEAYEPRLAEIMADTRQLNCPRLGNVDLSDDARRAETYEQLRLALKPAGRKKRQDYIEELQRLNPQAAPPGESGFLEWREIRELDRHPLVTVGAHGRSHIMLSRPNPFEILRELTYSRRRLGQELGRNVDIVAYPYGASTAMTRWLARYAGYRLGFSTQPVSLDTGYRRMSIPRVGIHEYLRSLYER